ncbi:GDP-mannose 4,6-dehydratase [Maricurvus nonylphenolicus]
MQKKILITGGTGFVGCNMAKALADKGYSVVSTTRGNAAGPVLATYSDLISVETVDLTNKSEVNDLFSRHSFDGILIMAAAHQDSNSRAENNTAYDMIFNTLNAACDAGVKRVIMASSMAVYGGERPPFNESTAFSPEISYEDGRGSIPLPKFEVRIRRAIEQVLLDYGTPLENPTGSGGADQETGEMKGAHTLDVAILRFPFQFGPGYARMGNQMAIAAHAVAGRIKNVAEVRGHKNLPLKPLWSIVGSILPPLYVKDTVNAFICALEVDELPHRIYNVVGNYPGGVKGQIEALYRAAPEAQEILGFDPEEFPDQMNDLGINSDLIKEDLGWEQSYSLEEAFKEYIDWLKDENNMY